MDLMGLDEQGRRILVAFQEDRMKPNITIMNSPPKKTLGNLTEVAHAVLDLNNDYLADLCLTTTNGNKIHK